MTFTKWLREEKGYPVYDAYDIMEQLSSVEADILWQEYDASGGYAEYYVKEK